MDSNANVTTTPSSALRLVSTKGMSREEWLKVRKSGLGSSDAAAAIGLNPYQSKLELWMIKTGRAEAMPQADPDDQSSPMYWGNVLEPIVAEHYSLRTGRKVRRVNAVLQHRDPDKTWMLANLDYSVVGDADVQILECKTAGEFGSRLWKEGVPEYVQCQVQHQLAVTGKQTADVCVLLCGQEVRIYRVERDEKLIACLIDLEERFWACVKADVPPLTDGSDSAALALRYLYPRDSGQVLDLREDSEMCQSFDQLQSIRRQQERLKQAESALKQSLQQRMGDASKALFESGHVTWRKSKDAMALDVKRLLDDQPDLLARYPLTRPGSRRFLITS
ncbi:YqaJ viral recombinase family protein [Pseudomonas sp. NP21570]|uniref:YqaJ viral recombinase family nuclease n=1 Tax=Stutzerimonas kunmingensis TaxID=1211807 RepID=UPI001E2CB154|nr:YqaJ viral recombinase family protein [Stutzerimonas kunmingensis]MCB4797009.1 YqaJ viral recombinase family protein [Pseudomonas sp. NP21570]